MRAELYWLTVFGCLLFCPFDGTANEPASVGWNAPVPVSELNTPYHDKAAFQSFDGLTLYFCRDGDPDRHYTRIYEAARTTPFGPFGSAEEIHSLTRSGEHVAYPWVSADNLRMYYYVAGGYGKRLKFSQRPSAGHSWPPGCDIMELNALGDLANPTLTENELTIVFSGYWLEGGRGAWDLWTASRSDRREPFGDIVNLGSINTEAWDMHPSLAPDGLTLYFASNRGGRFQIFETRRASLDTPFGDVQHMTVFDTPDGSSMYPSISADGSVFYFARWKDDGYADMYTSHPRGIYYVDMLRGSDTDNGWSPQTAFATIQRAIDVAWNGDTVNVLPGVYREAIRFKGKAITVRSVWDAAILEAPNAWAVSFQQGEGPQSVLKNLIIRNSRVGIWVLDSSPTISNVTVVGNEFGIDASGAAHPCVGNCVLWDNTVSDLYGCRATYSCIERGGEGEGNFSRNPLFVDAENGDYHVRSARGRYWPEHDIWVLDDVTSPCVDAGDPVADFSAERKPNGGRLNVGAHGGTAFAAMSEPPLSAVADK